MDTILHQFLIQHNYSNLRTTFMENYESHPNFPSLFAITDTFSLLGIENIAASVPKDQLDELPVAFLGYLEGTAQMDMALINRRDDKIAVVLEGKKQQLLSTDDFKAKWNGVLIAIESGESSFVKPRHQIGFVPYLLVGLFGLFFVNYALSFTAEAIISYGLYSLGLLISIFIIQEKLTQGQESGSKFCELNASISCTSVIQSSGAKITRWLDFSDLPILFFATAVLAMLMDQSAYQLLNLISLLSVPVVAYSVWLQKKKLKKWCTLCLNVSLILLLQAAMFRITGFSMQDNIRSLITVVVLTVPLWFFLKKYLEQHARLENSNKELKRFKKNFKVFDFLQQPLKIQAITTSFSCIEIGDSQNPIKISLVVSPGCTHCHTAFEQAKNLYHSHTEKISLTVFYNLNPENKDNPFAIVAKNMMQINANHPGDIMEALSDWHIAKMSMPDWLFKWEQPTIEDAIIDDLKAQYDWCLQNDFNYTPVNIVNGKEFPKEYNLEELKYFISALEEETVPSVMA